MNKRGNTDLQNMCLTGIICFMQSVGRKIEKMRAKGKNEKTEVSLIAQKATWESDLRPLVAV